MSPPGLLRASVSPHNGLLLQKITKASFLATTNNRSFGMKKLSILCVTLCAGLSVTTAFARGGGMGHMSVTGGAVGSSAAAAGTNSLETALSSSGMGNGPMKGPLLGTDTTINREDAAVDKATGSIRRGC